MVVANMLQVKHHAGCVYGDAWSPSLPVIVQILYIVVTIAEVTWHAA